MEFLKSLYSFRQYINEIGIKPFLVQYRLLPASKVCEFCNGTTNLVINKKKYILYRCTKRACRRWGKLRDGSIFQWCKVDILSFLLVIIGWILKYPTSVITREVNVSKRTVSKIMNHCRELLSFWLMETGEVIGGINHIVEIDESCFGRRKYNRGRIHPQLWVIGGIDRNTKRCFLVMTRRRNAATLEQIISRYVENGTIIKTDEWRGYRGLTRLGYIHNTVNHSQNFVAPNDPETHTQNVEALWSKIKRDMRRRIGRMCNNRMETHLVEFMWRNTHTSLEELFNDFILAVNNFYVL